MIWWIMSLMLDNVINMMVKYAGLSFWWIYFIHCVFFIPNVDSVKMFENDELLLWWIMYGIWVLNGLGIFQHILNSIVEIDVGQDGYEQFITILFYFIITEPINQFSFFKDQSFMYQRNLIIITKYLHFN